MAQINQNELNAPRNYGRVLSNGGPTRVSVQAESWHYKDQDVEASMDSLAINFEDQPASEQATLNYPTLESENTQTGKTALQTQSMPEDPQQALLFMMGFLSSTGNAEGTATPGRTPGSRREESDSSGMTDEESTNFMDQVGEIFRQLGTQEDSSIPGGRRRYTRPGDAPSGTTTTRPAGPTDGPTSETTNNSTDIRTITTNTLEAALNVVTNADNLAVLDINLNTSYNVVNDKLKKASETGSADDFKAAQKASEETQKLALANLEKIRQVKELAKAAKEAAEQAKLAALTAPDEKSRNSALNAAEKADALSKGVLVPLAMLEESSLTVLSKLAPLLATNPNTIGLPSGESLPGASADSGTPTPLPGAGSTPTPTPAIGSTTPTPTPAIDLGVGTPTPTPAIGSTTPTPTPAAGSTTPTPTPAIVVGTNPTPTTGSTTPTPTPAMASTTPTPTPAKDAKADTAEKARKEAEASKAADLVKELITKGDFASLLTLLDKMTPEQRDLMVNAFLQKNGDAQQKEKGWTKDVIMPALQKKFGDEAHDLWLNHVLKNDDGKGTRFKEFDYYMKKDNLSTGELKAITNYLNSLPPDKRREVAADFRAANNKDMEDVLKAQTKKWADKATDELSSAIQTGDINQVKSMLHGMNETEKRALLASNLEKHGTAADKAAGNTHQPIWQPISDRFTEDKDDLWLNHVLPNYNENYRFDQFKEYLTQKKPVLTDSELKAVTGYMNSLTPEKRAEAKAKFKEATKMDLDDTLKTRIGQNFADKFWRHLVGQQAVQVEHTFGGNTVEQRLADEGGRVRNMLNTLSTMPPELRDKFIDAMGNQHRNPDEGSLTSGQVFWKRIGEFVQNADNVRALQDALPR